MKKLFTLLTMLCISTGLWAQSNNYSGIEISFNKSASTETNFMNVTVTVKDLDGNAISGVTAEPVSWVASDLINSSMGSTAALSWTEKVLIGGRYSSNNYPSAASQDFVLKISGLRTDFAFNKAEVDLYGCNQSGASVNSSKISISCAIQTGNAADNLSAFVSSTGNKINGSQEGGLYHKVATMTSTTNKTVAENEDLYVKVTIQKTADGDGTKCRPSFRTVRLSEDYTNLMKEKIQPFVENTGNGYFQINSANAATLNEKITEFEEDNIVTIDEYNELLSDRDGYIKYPTTGYYRLKSYQTGTYLYVENEANDMYVGDNKSDVASSVVYINRGAGNSFSIKIQGKYILTPGPNNGSDAKTGDFEVFFTPTLGSVTPEPGYMALSSGGRCFYPKGNEIKSWGPNSLVSHWALTDASSITGNMTNANDNTGTGHSYATLCVPFAISSITGASAYAPTKNDNYLVMGDALESTIKAGTPVMLVGATNAGSYTANIETNTAPVSSPIDKYALKGTFTGTSIDCTKQTGTNYVLGFDRDNDNRIGFYHVNSSSYSLKANRAYLNLTGGDARGYNIMFDVDDDATGIVSTPGETEEGTTIYNLSGQRLNKMQKGINIVNGKKVLF